MGDDGRRQGGASLFLTERARARGPLALSFAAVTGGAVLVSPKGEIGMAHGVADAIDVGRIVRAAAALGGARALTSFRVESACVHAAPVGHGWMLCVLSTGGVAPALVIDRLRRASHVLALALIDGVAPSTGGSGGGGASAMVVVARR